MRPPNNALIHRRWGKNPQDKSIDVKFGPSKHGILSITPNLHLALQRLRLQTEDRWLWCDQLCIAQGDLDELAVQVNIMCDIYKRSRKVLIWTGDDDYDTPLLEEMCSKISSNTEKRTKVAETHNDDLV